jgi:death-on-curing protein
VALAPSAFLWPDPRALLDELAELMAASGQTLTLRSEADLAAGLARAPLAEPYGAADLHDLAALMFEGVATRLPGLRPFGPENSPPESFPGGPHPLVDGNKRLAFLAMVAFLSLNGAYLDAPEAELAHLCIAVVAKARTGADLAAFLRAHC